MSCVQACGSGRWVAVSRIALVGLIGGAAAACSTERMRFAEPRSRIPCQAARGARYADRASQSHPVSCRRADQPTSRRSQSQALPPFRLNPCPSPAARAAAPVPAAPGWTQLRHAAHRRAPTAQRHLAALRRAGAAILSANGLVDQTKVAPAHRSSSRSTARETPKSHPPRPAARRRPSPLRALRRPRGRALHPAVAAPASPARKASDGGPCIGARAELARRPPPEPQPHQAAAGRPPRRRRSSPSPRSRRRRPQPRSQRLRWRSRSRPRAVGPVGDFRWPARGRVIAGFGANGGNEGINIAVPEGTPVKAAEAGTVTYAGSEVKGYGNLGARPARERLRLGLRP